MTYDAKISGEDVLEFAESLARKREEFMALIQRIRTEQQRMDQLWDDKVSHRFMEQFDSYLLTVSAMCETLKQHSDYAKAKAMIVIEDYNGQR